MFQAPTYTIFCSPLSQRFIVLISDQVPDDSVVCTFGLQAYNSNLPRVLEISIGWINPSLVGLMQYRLLNHVAPVCTLSLIHIQMCIRDSYETRCYLQTTMYANIDIFSLLKNTCQRVTLAYSETPLYLYSLTNQIYYFV